ncbi:purine phosphoribosyltransferase family protein [Haloferax mediterranei ATCC 33500]|uniref:HGPRTase-like protein n=1 Tax=Haloferax mediterranei (strain ATCC 33500 / DSM 1411 / JCM 8866 / NBRC 14739 / NCIMB 2177 / R-4) TaxID=523841 RepID=I3R6X3_HALMT|nr:hypoxanthine/guanine phosphoribosyltransferase [Haloferax mediterranei]AFK19983.1 adenine phosphoribosyltransferase [Haloferax mediterranei ATCC 33500]AHZ23362.1 adenine phosphoribosyltransferase [Haloferax mediterranei ATCC 33500]ELZ99530.1 adenine phosphoribosyltransferase [Haloferax mediterranei ATCC 33500]MDX5987264.1 hypoxanthine/guanine phosphoribosyltransferase [Haloferax mediterranei ATCC 33500]QCQ73786.1 purine phosphoribosyltransferase family protein [Haloferax mediterranei ATCC 3
MQQLEQSLHEAPIIDKDGYHYLVHPISNGVPMLDPELLREVVIGISRVADLDVDKIVAPEAMGIHIATALSLQTDIPLVVIRKREYGLDGEVALHQTTGYSESEMYINDVEEGDRVLIVDDLLSTGGTLAAICDALDDIGADISDIVVAIRKVGETALDDTDYEATSLIDITVDGDEVTIH